VQFATKLCLYRVLLALRFFIFYFSSILFSFSYSGAVKVFCIYKNI